MRPIFRTVQGAPPVADLAELVADPSALMTVARRIVDDESSIDDQS